MTGANRILLGHIGGAHGIRGEVVIRSYAAVPEDIGAYGPLVDETGRRTFTIAGARNSSKGVVAKIAGIADRNAAEALRGTALYVAREALPAPGDGEYYHADLVGMTAVGPDGTVIGDITAVPNFGAGDLLEIRVAGQRDTELIPFTDAFVPNVDLASRRVVVIPPVVAEDDDAAERS